MKTLMILTVVMASLFACSAEQSEPTGVIPQAQKDALEKAKNVEEMLKKQADESRKKIEEVEKAL
jgi:ABC-type transporter MlaC component